MIKDIVKVMNNGIRNESTLALSIPMIVKLATLKAPEKLTEIQNWFIPENVLSRPHPGLDGVLSVCQDVINGINLNQEAVMRK